MIAMINHRDPMTKMEHEDLVVQAQLADTTRGSVTYDNPVKRVPPLLSSVAQDGADQIVERQTGIAHDERAAAELIEPTFGGC